MLTVYNVLCFSRTRVICWCTNYVDCMVCIG